MEHSSPARLYAGLVGATLVVAGIIGFFYSSDFGSPGDVDAVFGILDVNGWHNVVHILTGALGLLAFGAKAGDDLICGNCGCPVPSRAPAPARLGSGPWPGRL